MARAPVMAAGGIVLRRAPVPLVAVVRQRKRNEWVLPKGKLDDGETPREAAHREVLEETGHDVAVHEFLGTLVYQSGGRSKVVHYWRMEADGGPVRKLMNDIKAVDWLTLDDAIARLSREYERVFLTQIGPIALAAAGLAPLSAPEPKQVSEPVSPLAKGDIDASLQTLTQAEAASIDELRHGLLRKVKAWLRGEA
ncbi:NUDIX hydrolase [Bradyrhizobium yuanmingense]|uniref:NUDIX hydrolase n=1 Tax=Bradyrhizobium yuanmingense TaxID=108015 RepID=UPI000FE3A700|nr:NUDIX hydrolase [Bradyrhizobium yuanmingense]TGN88083.1 NUDIX hydrolase [Bradyrhizobium yuanmingense]